MKRKYYIGMLLAASYLLSGCGIYNRYSRPETDINTDSLYRMPVQSADSTTMATKLWRELFTDPHLQTLMVIIILYVRGGNVPVRIGKG